MVQVGRILQKELVQAVVVDVRAGLLPSVKELMALYPRIPVFAYSAFRPDDGRLLAACNAAGLRGILVDGIDEPIAGEFVAGRSAASERKALLADAPRRLRLTEPVQIRAWEEVLDGVETPLRTAEVAAVLQVSREHLSREFAAGGAPNLKRVIDLARIACAAHLMGNPGYTVTVVAGILRFSSPGHLSSCARRVAGLSALGLADTGSRGVLERFVRGRTRSRL